MSFRLAAVVLSIFMVVLFGAIPVTASRPSDTFIHRSVRIGGLAANIYVPETLSPYSPAQVLVVIHGMGGNGRDTLAPWIEIAEREGWIIVAPTMRYNPNWKNSDQLRKDDPVLVAHLRTMIRDIPNVVGFPVEERVMLYGFSRGAQMAHRYALFYPEDVIVVSACAAGSYTLPKVRADNGDTLNFPYGVADLDAISDRTFNAERVRKVSFLIQVGANDNRAEDLARAWDPYQGTNRVERARSFAGALEQLSVPVMFVLHPNTAHTDTAAMRRTAVEFFLQIKQQPIRRSLR